MVAPRLLSIAWRSTARSISIDDAGRRLAAAMAGHRGGDEISIREGWEGARNIESVFSSVGPWSVLLHCVICTRRDCFGYFKQGRYVIAKGALLLDKHKQRICARFPLGALKGYGQHFS
jgi:hypothetical protein